MKIIQIQCPSCLGRLEVDWDSGKAVCQYCLNELLIKPEQKKQEQTNQAVSLKSCHAFKGPSKKDFIRLPMMKRHVKRR